MYHVGKDLLLSNFFGFSFHEAMKVALLVLFVYLCRYVLFLTVACGIFWFRFSQGACYCFAYFGLPSCFVFGGGVSV